MMDAENPDAALQFAVYENISELFAACQGIPSQGAAEEECRRLVTLLESSFWMIYQEQVANEQYRWALKEAEEINDEDLEAASDMFDQLIGSRDGNK